jgi:hypothetical protein
MNAEPLYSQTKLDVQLEGMAMILRESSRHAGGSPRIGIELSRTIAYRFYEYMRQEGMVIEPGYGYVETPKPEAKKPRKTRSDKGKPRKKKRKIRAKVDLKA